MLEQPEVPRARMKAGFVPLLLVPLVLLVLTREVLHGLPRSHA